MPTRFPLTAVISVALLLAACADRSANIMGAGPSAGCHAVGAAGVLGQRLDERVMQEALRDSGALRTRVIPPGVVGVTGDVDPMRLNIQLDAQGRIHRMVCG